MKRVEPYFAGIRVMDNETLKKCLEGRLVGLEGAERRFINETSVAFWLTSGICAFGVRVFFSSS